jgi:hypothetical protein
MLNNSEQKVITLNRAFWFNTQLVSGDKYDVKVVAQPVDQVCTITNSIGSFSDTDIGNILVSCSFTNTQSSGGGSMDQRWLMLLALLGVTKGLGNRKKSLGHFTR